MGLSVSGIMYNAKYFETHKLKAPTRWTDLADEVYKKKIVFPSANALGTGFNAMLIYNRIAGGSEEDISPGLAYIKKYISPNVLTYGNSAGQFYELFQQGEIIAFPWESGLYNTFISNGFPAKFSIPEDGAIFNSMNLCPIVGSKVSKEVQLFIDYLLSPEAQLIVAKDMGYGPANRTVVLDDELASRVPYGVDAVSKFIRLDWEKIYGVRADWDKRWVREIEN
jgi:putative spermidine/putrescine transport system substrate-binding protein